MWRGRVSESALAFACLGLSGSGLGEISCQATSAGPGRDRLSARAGWAGLLPLLLQPSSTLDYTRRASSRHHLKLSHLPAQAALQAHHSHARISSQSCQDSPERCFWPTLVDSVSSPGTTPGALPSCQPAPRLQSQHPGHVGQLHIAAGPCASPPSCALDAITDAQLHLVPFDILSIWLLRWLPFPLRVFARASAQFALPSNRVTRIFFARAPFRIKFFLARLSPLRGR